jgi:hypothetical protein
MGDPFLTGCNKIICTFVLSSESIFMKRNITLRLLIGILVVSLSMILFSYAHSRVSRAEEPNGETDKCSSGKAQTEYILWETLTHNLLTVKN